MKFKSQFAALFNIFMPTTTETVTATNFSILKNSDDTSGDPGDSPDVSMHLDSDNSFFNSSSPITPSNTSFKSYTSLMEHFINPELLARAKSIAGSFHFNDTPLESASGDNIERSKPCGGVEAVYEELEC